MNAIYELRVQAEFAAAHLLRDYPGSCGRLHGHNWKVEVEVRANRLNEQGMGMDFREIRRATRSVTDRLDHQYLNELEPFTETNPTAEHIAAHCFHEIARQVTRPGVALQAVTVWENDRSCVRYTEEEA